MAGRRGVSLCGGAAPELETARLRLTGHGPADLKEAGRLWGDPEVVRYIGGRPFAEDEVWSRILRYVGHWSLFGYGFWAIRERAGGAFVGEIGFGEMRRGLPEPFGRAPEIGWALVPGAQGRGYASEALTAVLAWAETRFGRDFLSVCMIDPRNAPSIRLAERHGYQAYEDAPYRGSSVRLFRRGGGVVGGAASGGL